LILTDGIIGGEGDGPLAPVPVPLGYLSFSDNICLGDHVNCLAMGFDPQQLPMLREASKLEKYALTDGALLTSDIRLNGQVTSLAALQGGVGKKFLPPREWRAHLRSKR
jgi:uncharacterized protein (DUF362 family)